MSATLIPLGDTPISTPAATAMPSADSVPEPWWSAYWVAIATFLFIFLGLIMLTGLLYAFGTGLIDSRGNWLRWYNHDQRYRARLSLRRRRVNQGLHAHQATGGAVLRPRPRRPAFLVFNVNFNWRPRFPAVRLPAWRARRRRTPALPVAQPLTREPVGQENDIPLSDRLRLPTRPGRTLMSERDLVRREGIVTGGLTRIGVM